MMRALLPVLAVVALVGPLLYLQHREASDTGVFYEPLYFTPLENDTDPSEAYPIEQLGAADRHTLLNVTDFSYTMLPDKLRDCGPAHRPFIIALIHSAPQNVARRAVIRSTWLQHRNQDFVGLFLLGQVGVGVGDGDAEEAQKRLHNENRHYGDMVQGTFTDSYHNMTYKHAMTLKWAVYQCPGARYVVKTDDDVAVNLPYLQKLLQTMSPYGVRDLLLCSKRAYTTVLRSYRSKWRVSFKEYPDYSYPKYCSGGAVIYSPDVVFRIYKQVQRLPYFWIDDVHVTGTAAVAANIRHMHFLPEMNPFSLRN